MIVSIILIVVSVVLIIYGADRLTEGSSALARRMGMSEMVVGLTVVSFGTSLPEFVISFFGSLTGSSDICVGNVVGSNLFNTLVIVGCSALACPITIGKSTVRKDIPFVILATALLMVLVLDTVLAGDAHNRLTRGDGAALLLFFCVFMAYTLAIAKDEHTQEDAAGQMPVWKAVCWCLLGLAGLVLGGDVFVDNATAVAREMGVSEMVVGLTIAAGGTSLPELATSVVAARKGHSALAIGNVIGSNVFNVLLVLGACSASTPMVVDSLSLADMLVLMGSVLVLWVFARSRYTISRIEGAVLILLYVGYICTKITGL